MSALVQQWLESLRLEQYLPYLLKAGFDTVEKCAYLTDELLKSLNIEFIGHRKRILTNLPHKVDIEEDSGLYGNVEMPNPFTPSAPSPTQFTTGAGEVPASAVLECRKSQDVTKAKTKGYIPMDKKPPQPTPEETEDIYVAPPPPRPVMDSPVTTGDSQIPILPPKKITAREDIDAKLGITQKRSDSVEDDSIVKSSGTQDAFFSSGSTTPVAQSPIGVTPTSPLTPTDGFGKPRPTPRPRPSIQSRKSPPKDTPVPMPRNKKSVKIKGATIDESTDESTENVEIPHSCTGQSITVDTPEIMTPISNTDSASSAATSTSNNIADEVSQPLFMKQSSDLIDLEGSSGAVNIGPNTVPNVYVDRESVTSEKTASRPLPAVPNETTPVSVNLGGEAGGVYEQHYEAIKENTDSVYSEITDKERSNSSQEKQENFYHIADELVLSNDSVVKPEVRPSDVKPPVMKPTGVVRPRVSIDETKAVPEKQNDIKKQPSVDVKEQSASNVEFDNKTDKDTASGQDKNIDYYADDDPYQSLWSMTSDKRKTLASPDKSRDTVIVAGSRESFNAPHPNFAPPPLPFDALVPASPQILLDPAPPLSFAPSPPPAQMVPPTQQTVKIDSAKFPDEPPPAVPPRGPQHKKSFKEPVSVTPIQTKAPPVSVPSTKAAMMQPVPVEDFTTFAQDRGTKKPDMSLTDDSADDLERSETSFGTSPGFGTSPFGTSPLDSPLPLGGSLSSIHSPDSPSFSFHKKKKFTKTQSRGERSYSEESLDTLEQSGGGGQSLYALAKPIQRQISAASVDSDLLRTPPPPPPKVNPFSHMYDASRGTYLLEQDIDCTSSMAEAVWESDGTLSDGGFPLDDDIDNSSIARIYNARQSIKIVPGRKVSSTQRKGYLYKQQTGISSTGSSFNKSITRRASRKVQWKKRWVTFDCDNLVYYSNEKSFVSKRMIPITSILNVEQDIKGDHKQYRFKVTTVDRVYWFAAEDADDLSMWTNLIMHGILESKVSDFVEGGEMHIPDKEGYIKMEGAKGKRYVAIKEDKLCYYNTYSDFKAGCPIYKLEMKLASVKDLGKHRIQLITPYAQYILLFDHQDELESWKDAMEYSIAASLSDDNVLNEIIENHSNRQCADCSAPNPDWASLNLAITLCKNCAGIHRNLIYPFSKVKSLRMDSKVWTEQVIQILTHIGNDNANNFWEWNITDTDRIEKDAEIAIRKDFINNKYKGKQYCRPHPLHRDQKALNEAFRKSVQYSDLNESYQLLYSGAEIDYCPEGPSETPIDWARRANQTLQVEFLRVNNAEIEGSSMHMQAPPREAIGIPHFTEYSSLEGYLHKTGSNPKGGFLKRWIVLNKRMLSYYDNEKSSSPNDSIEHRDMLSITKTSDDRHEYCFELASLKKNSRIYLFAASTNAERQKWVQAIAQNFTNASVDAFNGVVDFEKGGNVFLSDGASGKFPKTWIHLRHKTLSVYDIEEKKFDDVDLRKTNNIKWLDLTESCPVVFDITSPFFIVGFPNRVLYIQSEVRKDTEVWYQAILKAAKDCGKDLSEQQLTADDVPVIVEKCINFIALHGMRLEGVYRLNGQHSKVTDLLDKFNTDARDIHLKLDDFSVHDVANTLKRYFRSLPNPLLTSQLHHKWISYQLSDEPGDHRASYKQTLKELPQVNYNTLKKLITHLARIAEYERDNKMSVKNLSAIFGPALMTTDTSAEESGNPTGYGSTNEEIGVVRDLIYHHKYLFNLRDEEVQHELKMQEAINKINMLSSGGMGVQAGDMLVGIYLDSSSGDCINVRVPPDMTAKQVIDQVIAQRRLSTETNWAIFEIICQGELERPLHPNEKVLDVTLACSVWPDEYRKDHYLCVKKNYVFDLIQSVFNPGNSLFGEFKFSEKKGFKKFCFGFSNYKLSYQKDPRSQTIASWNVEDLTVYIGVQSKRNPPTKYGFTFTKKDEKIVKTKDTPYFGHSVCCTKEELYRWLAAMIHAQHPKGLDAYHYNASQTSANQIENLEHSAATASYSQDQMKAFMDKINRLTKS